MVGVLDYMMGVLLHGGEFWVTWWRGVGLYGGECCVT